MPTTIDTLVVELVLAVDKFQKGVAQAQSASSKIKQNVNQQWKDFEALNNKANDALMNLGRRALSVAGILMGGLGVEKMVAKFVPMNAELGRTAHFLGMSSRELLVWQNTGRTVGAAVEEITGNFEALTDQLQQFEMGLRPDVVNKLIQLGINPRDKTAEQVFKEIAALNRIDPRRFATVTGLLGITPGMRNLLGLGPAELEKRLANSSRLMRDFSEKDTAAAQRLQEAWANAQTSLESLGRSISVFIEGPATELLQWLESLPLNWETRMFGEKGTVIRDFWDKDPKGTLLGQPGSILRNWWDRNMQTLPFVGPVQQPPRKRTFAPPARTGMGEGGVFTDRYGTWQLHPEMGSDEPVAPPPGATDRRSANETNINVASMVVNSRADNAAEIASDIRANLENRRLAALANTGFA